MASAAIALSESSKKERVADLSLESVKAPFLLRCAALFIDYMILLAIPVAWLVLGRLFTDLGLVTIAGWVWAIGIILFICNFVIMPLLRGRTVGKILLGLTILNIDRTPLSLKDVLKRNLLGYAATVLTLGIGFLIAAVNSSGRSLHDFIAGTIVIRGRRTEVK